MNARTLSRHKLYNALQSLLILGGMLGILATVGWLLGGLQLMVWSAAAGGVLLLLGPRVSPRLVLRMHGARPLTPEQAPALYATVTELARRAALPRVPTCYYVPSPVMNAFTVGPRQEAAVAVTDGLLRRLAPPELAAVLAHEISHLRNNDLWLMSLADLVSRVTQLLSLLGQVLVFVNLPLLVMGEATLSWLAIVLLVFAPALNWLLQLALARTREFDADLGAASLTGDPGALVSALAKLDQRPTGWLGSLFPERGDGVPALLRSHPGTAQRIQRLLALAPATRAAARRPQAAGLLPVELPALSVQARRRRRPY